MTHPFERFLQIKKELADKKKADFSERTLKYYSMLQEMLQREEEYGDSFSFLESVLNYIEENEYCTDKQMEIIDRISEHPNGPIDYNSSPF